MQASVAGKPSLVACSLECADRLRNVSPAKYRLILLERDSALRERDEARNALEEVAAEVAERNSAPGERNLATIPERPCAECVDMAAALKEIVDRGASASLSRSIAWAALKKYAANGGGR
jgi:hypothetical protein